MADGSKTDSPASFLSSDLTEPCFSPKCCSSCKTPVKYHPGSVELTKYLVGLLNALADRVSEIELLATKREVTFKNRKPARLPTTGGATSYNCCAGGAD